MRCLDADAVLALQTTMHKYQNNPIASTILLGKFIDVTPKLLAKSPELALTQLTVKTPKGELQGKASLSIDGKKVTSLNKSVLLSAWLAQASFSIGKPLLEQTLASLILSGEKAADNKKSLTKVRQN